ncbi:phosphomannomutase [Dyella sp. KRB-257]|uniref:phosphomannomutase n=1 Tax=Dyella sp. KRB-257 TaxID=3400915 RepID=UPI003C02E962
MAQVLESAVTPARSASCFKAYDLRGRVPGELDANLAYRLGLAYAKRFAPKRVAVGRDARLSGPELQNALAHGLAQSGAEVLDLGLCGTEEIYFAAFQPGCDGGIMITASHNPTDWNGMKLVRGGALPISGDSGLRELQAEVERSGARVPGGAARMTPTSFREAYVQHLLGYVDVNRLRPLKVVANPGDGCAGLVLDALAPQLPLRLVRMRDRPDGTFPHGVPNPLLPEHREATAEAVRAHGADFGIAWDGDFDRCFLFDENGRFIEGYYIVGLLAEAMLRQYPGAKIIHDPRLIWNTRELVERGGGIPVQSKTGHAFIKERMRAEDAIYGGEMSAHHYFRDFAYCDNGNIPWLLVAALLSDNDQPLSRLLDARMQAYPASGEINMVVRDIDAALARVADRYATTALETNWIDGLSMEFADWRFNLRASNTEPVLRLNVEARADSALMRRRTGEIERIAAQQ